MVLSTQRVRKKRALMRLSDLKKIWRHHELADVAGEREFIHRLLIVLSRALLTPTENGAISAN